ncbi:hypothetical protein [Halococcoides cellulosivorans]|uniref:Uncharacterized protein n=1 Tax=Halococcoides cellulosivorans TaxID=1679096 RepID=A0A2R4X3Z1_9EURY|nr:hypothetical protein [Halococcoides cellulosivorans]AWB28508.1 hypothetical protein HARCEL1_12770 [Halococcoides cellulosivorans]
MGLFDSIIGLFGGNDDDQSNATEGPDQSTQAAEETRVIDDRSAFGDENHVPPGCLVGDSVTDLREMAEDYAGTWEEFGPTDYSIESIRGVDEMFATQQDRANWLAIDLEDGRTGGFAPMAAQPACYFGEVLIRHYDAQWVLDRDYGWAIGFEGQTIVNLFGTAHSALDTEPPFVRMHDTFVENYDLDGELLEPDGERLEERRQDSGIDPSEIDADGADEDLAPEDMHGFADDFVDRHDEYDLDFSVESLATVDTLFEERYRTPEFADAELGETDDEASIVLTATASEAAGYFGEVIRRNTAAEWNYLDGDGLKLAFPSANAEIRVDPIATATSAIEDGDSFENSYLELRETVEVIDDELDSLDS